MHRAAAAWLTLSLVAAPAFAQGDANADDDGAAVWIGSQIATLDYGVYCANLPEEVDEAPGTAAGVINLVPLPEFQFRQLAVPAELGIAFGVVVQAQPGLVLDPAIVTVAHPPYPDSGIEVEQWISSFDGAGPGLVGFSFEVETELVPGPWTFSAEHDGKPLFSVTFEVVPPEVLPHIAGSCVGNLLF